MPMNTTTRQFSCIILAGGQGKRVHGQDKGLVLYKNKPLIEHVIATVKNQCGDIVISANRNIPAYKQFASKIISDTSPTYRGPLAGIAASLPHCKHQNVLVVACDMPALPATLVERLASDRQDNSICIATVDKRHQLAMIINKNLLPSIQRCLDNDQLKLITWVESVQYKTVSFDDMPDAFTNLNKL